MGNIIVLFYSLSISNFVLKSELLIGPNLNVSNKCSCTFKICYELQGKVILWTKYVCWWQKRSVGAPRGRRSILLLLKVYPFIAYINTVTDLRHHFINLCWWLIFNVDAKRLVMSPTSQTYNQHIRVPKSATNIEVAKIQIFGYTLIIEATCQRKFCRNRSLQKGIVMLEFRFLQISI